MLEKKEYSMRTYGHVNNFDKDVDKFDTLTEDGRKKVEERKSFYKNKVLQELNIAGEDRKLVAEQIKKITRPLSTSDIKEDRELAEAQINNVLHLLDNDLHSDYIIAEMQDAIDLKQYEKVSAITKHFTSIKDENIKSKKQLDIKYKIADMAKDAFKHTDLEKYRELQDHIDRQAQVMIAHLHEIDYGKKNNFEDWKKAGFHNMVHK